jgi:hypothetical protein
MCPSCLDAETRRRGEAFFKIQTEVWKLRKRFLCCDDGRAKFYLAPSVSSVLCRLALSLLLEIGGSSLQATAAANWANRSPGSE